jgi:predicted ribosomally synthesized peptide with SipW-like signal peptide
MNTKILLSLSVIAAVAAIVIGGTYAYFTFTQTSTGNTFTAATMTMRLNTFDTPTVGPALKAKNMYPGSFAQSAAIIFNTGEVAFNPEIRLANADDPSGMANYLYLEIWTNGKLWYRDWIKNFPGYTSGKIVLDTIQPGGQQVVAFRLIMVENAPNDLQGKEYSVNVVVTAHQWNDPDYQPSTPVDTGNGYVANNWTYPVCGVRQPNFWPPLLATDTYAARDYDTKYSPYFSYRVDSPMTPTNSKWMIQQTGSVTYPGGETNCTTDGDCYCTVK